MQDIELEFEEFGTSIELISSLGDKELSDLVTELNNLQFQKDNNSNQIGDVISRYFQEEESNLILKVLGDLTSSVMEFSDLFAHPISDILEDFLKDKCKDKKISNAIVKIIIHSPAIYKEARLKKIRSINASSFIGSRIISSIRPVFDTAENSLTEDFQSLLFHELSITYNVKNEEREFFVTLDEDDLSILSRTIGRALEKNKILKDKFEL